MQRIEIYFSLSVERKLIKKYKLCIVKSLCSDDSIADFNPSILCGLKMVFVHIATDEKAKISAASANWRKYQRVDPLLRWHLGWAIPFYECDCWINTDGRSKFNPARRIISSEAAIAGERLKLMIRARAAASEPASRRSQNLPRVCVPENERERRK